MSGSDYEVGFHAAMETDACFRLATAGESSSEEFCRGWNAYVSGRSGR